MPVARHLQPTFASGEFDPLLLAREDVAFYYSSAKKIENATPLPQGGAKRREGLAAKGLQRGILSSVAMGGYTLGAPNGGTAANLTSTSSLLTTTTNISTSTEYVVAKFDAGSNQRISVADCAAYLSSSSISTATLAIQSSNDDVTYTTRASIVIGETDYERRIAKAPDSGFGSHRYWRFAILNPGASDYGTGVVNIYKAAIYTEAGYSQSGGVPGNVKLKRITTGVDDEYFALITAGNVDIWKAGVWQAATKIPHTDAEVSEIKTSQKRDSLVLYQKDNPVHIVQRLDDIDDRWRSGEFEFSSVSQFPFEDSTSGGKNEIQEFVFSSMSGGDRIVFEYNGDISNEVAWSATAATNVTNFTTALESLEDVTSVTVTNITGNEYRVEFDGADANTFFATMIVDLLSGSGVVDVSRKQYGRPHQEDLWSSTRGYPRCGTFYQGRHWMGGFLGRSDVIVGSRSGDFGDFKEDADPVATSPLVLAPDIDEQVTVEHIYPGRSLQIFSSSAEIYVPSEPITPDNVALKVSSKRGTQALCQPVDVQGGTFFVDRNGTNIREYLFQETEQSYTAEPISTLGGHLVKSPVDMALRASGDTEEPTILYVINQGRDSNFDKVPAAAITIDRAQQVTAFARLVTPTGEFKAVATTQAGETAFIVSRELGGNEWNYFEIMDGDLLSDHAYEISNADTDYATATAGQTVFSYTFSNPLEVTDIAMFQREDTLDAWTRIEPTNYTLNTGAKTITLATGLDAGTLTVIAKRQTSFSTGAPELDGIACYVHCDKRPVGAHTPASGSVTIAGDEGFFIKAQIGLRWVPEIVLQAYKGQGGQSPTMENQRIFRVLLNVERTSHIAVAMENDRARAVALTDYDGAIYDQDLEEILFTGVKRVSGIGRWEKEPRLKITQTQPGLFHLRAASYDIKW